MCVCVCVCVCVTESFCYTAETNSIVNKLYFNKMNFKNKIKVKRKKESTESNILALCLKNCC